MSNDEHEPEDILELIQRHARNLLPPNVGCVLVVYSNTAELLGVSYSASSKEEWASKEVCIRALLTAAEAVAAVGPGDPAPRGEA